LRVFFLLANSIVDFEEGILQTIGFKEFIPYLKAFDESHDTLINLFVEAPETTPEPEGWKSLVMCLEELKMVTRRYSKKQMKWVRNRFLGSDMREVPLVYSLDTSDISRWQEIVSQPAIETVECFRNNDPIKMKPIEKVRRLAEGFDEEKSFHCSGLHLMKKIVPLIDFF
jgi:tRNA dimethylallyltransferase